MNIEGDLPASSGINIDREFNKNYGRAADGQSTSIRYGNDEGGYAAKGGDGYQVSFISCLLSVSLYDIL